MTTPKPKSLPDIDKLDEILEIFFKTATHSKDGWGVPAEEAKAKITQLLLEARIDELNHIQLEYGGRFGAMTYIDGDGQTITARIADLKALGDKK